MRNRAWHTWTRAAGLWALVGVAASAQDGVAADKAARAGKALAGGSQQQSEPAEKRALLPGDYGRFERLGRATLSPDGKWMAVGISRVDESRALHLHMLATDSAEVFEEGRGGVFSDDSNWFLYRVGPSPEERKKAEKSKKPVKETWHLRSLVDGKEVEFEHVAAASFRDDGAWLTLRKEKGEGAEGGATLVAHELATGVQTSFGNVASHAWNDDGSLLAMVVHTGDGLGNGLQVWDTRTGALRTLDSGEQSYVGLTWREDAADLAVMREHEGGDGDEDGDEHEDAKDSDEEVTHRVLAFRGLDRKKHRRQELDPSERESFPDRRVVSDAGLRWSEDGKALFFGVKEWEQRPEDEAGVDEDDSGEEAPSTAGKKDDGGAVADTRKATKGDDAGARDAGDDETDSTPPSLRESLDEPSNVEIWHARDIDIQPLQKKRAGMEDRRSTLSAWWLDDDAFLMLGSEIIEEVQLLDGGRAAVGGDHSPYERQRMFGPTLYDRYRIDTRTGEAVKFLEANKYLLGGGPDGRHVLYVRDDQIWVHDGRDGRHLCLTADLDSDFINHTLSNLTDEKPAWGVAGWSEDGDDVYLYDRWDLWRVRLDGKGGQRLTQGAEQQLRHRLQILDREDAEWIDPEEDMVFSLYGDRSKQSGFGRRSADGQWSVLRLEDCSMGGMVKAEDAEVFVWSEEGFDDSPDLFTAGPDLDEPRQVTETNAHQAQFHWGRSELVDYTNDRGEELQGALFYPAGYEEGRQYPMIVYIYELRSQVLHDYSVPTERHPYNTAVYTSQGYFVFQPDITYRPQNPGLSAKECVVPAVKTVLERGEVDPDRVGLVGHSWGGYQTAFLSTTTDLFAACVAGAPLTNMMSMSMSIYWNSGQTDAWIFHESQGRMDRPFWKDVETYMANSAIFNLETMRTPLLMAFGDEDGAVDWHQGIEFYNAARLAEKDFVLLVYPGENHSNAREENQVDYHHRVLEWFGHYLKGEEAPAWITEGKPFRERRDELKND